MSVRFRFDWIDAGPSRDERARLTMAALAIEADGAFVTAAIDRESRIYRDHVVVPLFGVAEWLVGNWWHLLYEIEDTRERKPGFEFRHDLAFAGDGFILPSLFMAPASEKVHIRWRRYKPRYARIEFVEEGETSVGREELETQFRILVDAVLERLHGGGVSPTPLDRDWTAMNALDADEREFGRAAALLGIDPFDVPDSLAKAMVALWESADPFVREDALATADADSLSCTGDWLAAAFKKVESAKSGGGWSDIRRRCAPVPGGPPWEQGYELARRVRRRLDAGDDRFNFDPEGPLALRPAVTRPPSPRIQGLVAPNVPACVAAPRGEAGSRFLMARALGDYVGRAAPGASILSSLATDRQARSRAFAAEFLAPAASLRRRLGGEPADMEKVDDLGREFGVSSLVIRRQIENHELGVIPE